MHDLDKVDFMRPETPVSGLRRLRCRGSGDSGQGGRRLRSSSSFLSDRRFRSEFPVDLRRGVQDGWAFAPEVGRRLGGGDSGVTGDSGVGRPETPVFFSRVLVFSSWQLLVSSCGGSWGFQLRMQRSLWLHSKPSKGWSKSHV